MHKTDDLRIESIKAVTSPSVICEEIPITETAAETTAKTRNAVHDIDGIERTMIDGHCIARAAHTITQHRLFGRRQFSKIRPDRAIK